MSQQLGFHQPLILSTLTNYTCLLNKNFPLCIISFKVHHNSRGGYDYFPHVPDEKLKGIPPPFV